MEEYHNQKGQLIGTLKEGVFRKIVSKERHLMRIHDAWGIQYDTLKDLNGKCHEIRIKETDEDVVYSIPFAVFFGSSVVEDYGDGLQAFCPRFRFTVEHKQAHPAKSLVIRNATDALIADIVGKTDVRSVEEARKLAKLLAIAYNTNKWNNMDLHALYKKSNDKSFKNYSVYVWSVAKIKNSENDNTHHEASAG